MFDWLSRHAGVPMPYVDHAAPAPLEELWSRGDLAAAFMCGLQMSPIPLLIASRSTSAETIDRLRLTLLAAAATAEVAPILQTLLLRGFAGVDAADYQPLLAQARTAEAAGCAVPG